MCFEIFIPFFCSTLKDLKSTVSPLQKRFHVGMNLAMHCDTISDSYIIQSCDRIEAHMATRSSLLAVELLICSLSTLAM